MSALFLQGNSRDVIKGLPADYFHCAMTSPPYFGLRAYKGGSEIWDGNSSCPHEWVDTPPRRSRKANDIANLDSKEATNRGNLGIELPNTNTCRLCAAWKGALGNEPTPELYLRHLVEICREVRRVLRPDGVFFINVGDSWSSGRVQHESERGTCGGASGSRISGKVFDSLSYRYSTTIPHQSQVIKPLDMVLIPEQLALALRADGWWVRSILIWAKGVSLSDEYKGNPMPESVDGWKWIKHKVKVAQSKHELDLQQHAVNDGIGRTTAGLNTRKERGAVDGWQDCPGCPKCEKNGGYVLRKGSWRPTDSFEYVLMVTKTNSYFCDREAVLEKIAPSTIGRGPVSFGGEKGRNYHPDPEDPNFRNGFEQWGRTYDYRRSNGSGGRNLRSVLAVPTRGFSGSHFAVYPPQLIEPLIKAATSEKGCCPKCGSPWARVIQKPEVPHDGETDCKNLDAQGNTRRLAVLRQAARERGQEYTNSSNTIGWLPTCQCGVQEIEPCRVLDPFSGAGTTALVAERLGLDSVGIDTSAAYIALAEDRIVEDEQKRIDEQIKQLRKEAKQEARLAAKNG